MWKVSEGGDDFIFACWPWVKGCVCVKSVAHLHVCYFKSIMLGIESLNLGRYTGMLIQGDCV